VSPAKTAKPIDMPFGCWTPVGPRKHVSLLDGVQILYAKGQFLAERTCPGRELCKADEPIELPFGVWTRVGTKKYLLYVGAHWRYLANTI